MIGKFLNPMLSDSYKVIQELKARIAALETV